MTHNQALNEKSQIKELDKAIKQAKKIKARKEAAMAKATLELEKAEQNEYSLMCARDQLHLSSLGNQVDWDMVFNYNPDETRVAYEYRKQVIRDHGITDTGTHNNETNQHIFCIEFDSDSQKELLEKINAIEFVFLKLLPNTKDNNRKCITIKNLVEEDTSDFTYYELSQDTATGQYSKIVRLFNDIVSQTEYISLEAALSHIQQTSNVAFDTTDQPHLLTVN